MGNASVCVNSEFLGDEVGRKGVDVLIDTLEGGRELPQEWSDRDDDDEDQEKVTPDEPGEGGTVGSKACRLRHGFCLAGRVACAVLMPSSPWWRFG